MSFLSFFHPNIILYIAVAGVIVIAALTAVVVMLDTKYRKLDEQFRYDTYNSDRY